MIGQAVKEKQRSHMSRHPHETHLIFFQLLHDLVDFREVENVLVLSVRQQLELELAPHRLDVGDTGHQLLLVRRLRDHVGNGRAVVGGIRANLCAKKDTIQHSTKQRGKIQHIRHQAVGLTGNTTKNYRRAAQRAVEGAAHR